MMMLSKIPKTKKVGVPGPKHPRFSGMLLRAFCNTISDVVLRNTRKNKEEAAECAKTLAKRMKESKDKCQEQIARRRRLSSLRAGTSKSSQK